VRRFFTFLENDKADLRQNFYFSGFETKHLFNRTCIDKHCPRHLTTFENRRQIISKFKSALGYVSKNGCKWDLNPFIFVTLTTWYKGI